MPFTQELLTLAGFVFAHATWSVSDLPENELLVPLAVVEKAGQRQLLRFEDDTQEQAIAQGKATLAKHDQDLDAWAFAREGQIQEAAGYTNVIVIEAKSRDSNKSVVFVQRFHPHSKGRFQLFGEPIVAVAGNSLPEAEVKQLLAYLYAGVKSHSKAAAQWSEWSSE